MTLPFSKSLRFLSACCVALRLVAAQGAAPIITNITMIGTMPQFGVHSDLGITNQIQYRTNLSQTNWMVLTNLFVAKSPHWFVDVAAPPASQRFYRVAAIETGGPLTVNMQNLTNFSAAMTQTNRSIRIMTFGDSVAAWGTGSKLNGLVPILQKQQQVYAGFMNQDGLPSWVSGGAYGALSPAGAWQTTDTNWWTGNSVLVSNATTFEWRSYSGNINADTAQIYYFMTPGDGSMLAQIKFNGGSWETLATLSADGVYGLTNYTTNLVSLHGEGAYQFQVVGQGGGTSGRVRVMGGGLWVEHRPTIRLSENSAGGMAWNDWTNIPENVRAAFWTNESPDLILIEEKSDAVVWSNTMPTVLNQISNLLPHADVVIIGTTQISTNHPAYFTNGGVAAQNAVGRNLALSYNYAYWDGFSPVPTFEQMVDFKWTVAVNYTDTDVHLNMVGGTALGQMLDGDMVRSLAAQSVK
jgi:hypothetical protein